MSPPAPAPPARIAPPRRRRALRVLLMALIAAPSMAHGATDLTGMSLEELLNLRVVGASKYQQSPADVAAAVSVLTREDIRAFGWRTLDEALASLPGVHTTYDRQYRYVGARGLGLPGDYGTRLLVTINGNRVNDAAFDTGQVDRRLPVDLQAVERIEFIAGPGGAVYGGNAMFGVVNVITRDGASVDGAELSLGGQSPQQRREGGVIVGRRSTDGVDLMLAVSAVQARGQDLDMDFGAAGVRGRAIGLDGERGHQVLLRAGLDGWSFDLAASSFRKDDPTAVYLSDPLVPGGFQGDAYRMAQLQYQTSLLDGTLALHGRLFDNAQRYSSVLNYGSAYSYPAESIWRGGELRMVYSGWRDHTVLAGIEYQDNPRVDQRVLDLAQPANDIVISSPGRRFGIYAQDEWRIDDALRATVGVRVDHDNVVGTAISPRAALIWRPFTATTTKLLYGQAHRSPNAYERDYTDNALQAANPDVRGERIDTLEWVLEQRAGSLLLRASAYQWTIHDYITLQPGPAPGVTQFSNGAPVDASGLELSLDRAWRWGGRLRSSVSLQRAREAAGSDLVNSPRVLGKVNYSMPLPVLGLLAGYEFRYDSRRRTLAGIDLGGYALSNLQLTAERVLGRLDLGVGVLNLFGKRYAQPGADTNWQNQLPQDGRAVRLEARYRF